MRVQQQSWVEIRKQLSSSKWRGVLVCDEPSPYYMHIPTQYSHLSNVLPEEQEEIVFTELKLFLLGNQTENIRIGEYDEHNLPSTIDVNISFDPYIRSELERFYEPLIAISTIKKCCFAITHDTVTYALISATVASAIEKKVDSFVYDICEKLDGLGDSTQQLNSLFREVHTIHESLMFYSEIVKTIFVEKLIGGQVLTLLDNKRRHIYGGNVLKDLEDVFRAGWKVFAKYIGQLVCKFEADYLSYEFVIWSTKDMTEQQMKQIATSAKHTKSNRFVIIESLCPKFFTKYLDILVRCAEFGDVGGQKILKNATKNEKNRMEKESIEHVMEDVRNVDWHSLDVPTTARMLLQFSRKESACLLREITSATNVDQAIKDIHDLLLGGSCAHQVVMQCIKMDILEKPIDEIGNIRLKKLTNDVFGVAAEQDHPFWKYISFRIDRRNVFETLVARMQPIASEPNQQYALFECLTVSMACPIDIEPIISTSAFFGLEPIFRVWLQLHVASWKIANFRDSFRGMMPQSSGSDMAIKKHLISALGTEIDSIKNRWIAYVSVAISTYHERILKAVSLDEYTECQDQLNRDITKMIGITELSQIEIIKDLLNIVWSYELTESIADLIADLEEVQSRARLGAVTVA